MHKDPNSNHLSSLIKVKSGPLKSSGFRNWWSLNFPQVGLSSLQQFNTTWSDWGPNVNESKLEIWNSKIDKISFEFRLRFRIHRSRGVEILQNFSPQRIQNSRETGSLWTNVISNFSWDSISTYEGIQCANRMPDFYARRKREFISHTSLVKDAKRDYFGWWRKEEKTEVRKFCLLSDRFYLDKWTSIR